MRELKGGGSRPNYSGLNDQTTKCRKVENDTGRKFPPVERLICLPPPEVLSLLIYLWKTIICLLLFMV